jgi:sugar/nucleoside kinase (ribokinase family)
MSVLVVGSVALDSVVTPMGEASRVVGGSAVFFAAAASIFCPVQVVGVVGDDYPMDALDFLRARNVDLSGVEHAAGESFHWAGVYSRDMNDRDTVETKLGVFADFEPQIPESFRDARIVFLGNIDPALQLEVLKQVKEPALVACDTMNYWIDGKRDELLELLKRVDILLVNDQEAKFLAEESNLVRAARWIQEQGPDMVVVKKGEHGAILFGSDTTFFAPGYPLEELVDPTGAGDAFAGGFLGCLAAQSVHEIDDYRRAMIYGSVTGSFAAEDFSVDRFVTLDFEDIAHRVREFQQMTAFEHNLEPIEEPKVHHV